MTVYSVVSIFDYNYAFASILGLCFYGPLPKLTLGVPTSWTLVVILLLVAPEILCESQIWVESQIFESSTYNLRLDQSSTSSLHNFYQYVIFLIFHGDFGKQA
jgi:hypothetical protein